MHNEHKNHSEKCYSTIKRHRYRQTSEIIHVMWAISAVGPTFRQDWPLENFETCRCIDSLVGPLGDTQIMENERLRDLDEMVTCAIASIPLNPWFTALNLMVLEDIIFSQFQDYERLIPIAFCIFFKGRLAIGPSIFDFMALDPP